jgi:hypothetical protein
VIVDNDPVAWAEVKSLSGASEHTKYSMTVSKRSRLSSIAGPGSDAASSFLEALSKRSRQPSHLSKTSLPSIHSRKSKAPDADDWLNPKK